MDAPLQTSTVQTGRAAHVERIDSLDFVKGALVLFMVLYHWLNYFIGLDWGGYRYLRFLTPSFMFITGFLVSHVYLARYAADDPKLRWRLVTRGLKLLALFTALNVVADLVLGWPLRLRSGSASLVMASVEDIFVFGTGRAAFDVLVSIAYFLLIAPFIVFFADRLRISLLILAGLGVAGVMVMANLGQTNRHVEMSSFGLVGLALGVPRGVGVFRVPSAVALGVAYALYLAAVTYWHATYPLQVIGVCLTLLGLHEVALAAGPTGKWQRQVVTVGRYSLWAYIVQIAVLQGLRLTLRPWGLSGSELLFPLGVAFLLTVLAVECVRLLRMRSSTVDVVYRAVFA